MDLHLNGKAVVVTGGSKGIGYAVAKQFLEEGAKVTIVARNAEELKQAKAELEKFGPVFACQADASKEADVYRIAKEAYDHFARLDVWINNVGATGNKAGEDYTEAEIDFVTDVCFKSAVYGCQAAHRYMKEQGGSIVNISSLAARCPSAGRSTLYGPMKAAVVNLTQTMAGEYCAEGIRVNCVMPGFTLTPLVKAHISEAELEYNRKGTLLHRLAEPEDIAKPVVFLASDAASYMTGTTIEVSGGRSVTLNPAYAWEK